MTQPFRSLLPLLCGFLLTGLAWGEGPTSGPEQQDDDTQTVGSQDDGAEEGSHEEVKADDDAPYDKTIRWATASEVDNFGYDVYRGDSADGPFARLTEEPIPGAGTTDEPSYYTYVDEGLDPAKDYFYYIESVSMHGQRERFTPIQKVAARRPLKAAEPSATAEDPEEPRN